MRKLVGVLAVLLMGVSLGCTPLSLNVQRSAIRAGADLATTVMLVRRDDLKPEEVQAAADKLIEFLETGDVSALPLDELKDKLLAQVPVQYAPLVAQVLQSAETQTVDSASVIGKANVARMIAAAKGMRTAAVEFDTTSAHLHSTTPCECERHAIGIHLSLATPSYINHNAPDWACIGYDDERHGVGVISVCLHSATIQAGAGAAFTLAGPPTTQGLTCAG